MKLKTKNVLLLSGIIFLMACKNEKVVDSPFLKNVEQKLVVNSIISPFVSDIIVTVHSSRKTFGATESFIYLTDAIVKISDGTNEVLIPYEEEEGHFYSIPYSSFPLEEGKTYRLDVTVQGQSVYGETTLPKKVLSLTSSNVTERNLLTLSWQDFPEEGNYYRLTGYIGTEKDDHAVPFYFDNENYISDLNRNGKKISVRQDFSDSFDYDGLSIVRIISSDKMYSDYFRTLHSYKRDDPFGNPVHLPSNIVGGIGLFKAVQMTEFLIKK